MKEINQEPFRAPGIPRVGRRGRRALYLWHNSQKPITEVLRDPNIRTYLERNGPHNGENLTLTEILDRNPDIRHRYFLEGTVIPLAQRNRLRQALTNNRHPLAPGPRHTRPININNEDITPAQALERYPTLRGFLQPSRRVTEQSLRSKLRRSLRQGRIPDDLINADPPAFRPFRQALNSTIQEYKLNDPRIHKHDMYILSIFNYLKLHIIEQIQQHPNHKVYLNIHTTMMQPEPGDEQPMGLRSGVQDSSLHRRRGHIQPRTRGPV